MGRQGGTLITSAISLHGGFLRIFPLYYGALFVGLVILPSLHPLVDPKYATTVQHQVWLWTYASNLYESWSGRALPLYGHFWSLAVEEQFYLIWPLVVYWAGRRTLMGICAACFLGAFVTRLVLLLMGADPALAVLRLTPCQLDSLAAGAFPGTPAASAGPTADRRVVEADAEGLRDEFGRDGGSCARFPGTRDRPCDAHGAVQLVLERFFSAPACCWR